MAIDEEVIVEEEVIEETETTEEETIEETEVSEEEQVDESEDEETDEEEERVVTIGDPDPEEEQDEEHKDAPGWVKKVRKVNRQQDREIKRLKKQLEEATKPQEEEVVLGDKPTLESSGFDDKKFEKDLIDWHERSREVETQKAEKAKVVEEQNKIWQGKQERYVDLKQEHNFKDFEEAQAVVSDTLSKVQQGIILQGADDSALVTYALGKNPAKAEKLAKITDHVEFAFKVAKLEAQLKVTNKKAPTPEKRVSKGSTGSGSTDKTLARLREKAEKSGDYSELTAYKKKLRGAN